MDNNLDGKEATEEELNTLFEHMGFKPAKRPTPKPEESEEDKVINDICKHLGI